jgi:hypothetical protein
MVFDELESELLAVRPATLRLLAKLAKNGNVHVDVPLLRASGAMSSAHVLKQRILRN